MMLSKFQNNCRMGKEALYCVSVWLLGGGGGGVKKKKVGFFKN